MPRKPLDNEREYGSLVVGGAISPLGFGSAHGRDAVLTEARCQVDRGINDIRPSFPSIFTLFFCQCSILLFHSLVDTT